MSKLVNSQKMHSYSVKYTSHVLVKRQEHNWNIPVLFKEVYTTCTCKSKL